MGLFERLRNLFGKGEAQAERPAGLFERAKQRRVERQARRSQKIMEKLEKQRVKEEEQRKKAEDLKRKEEAYKKSQETFKERWGFNDQEHESFIQFISSVPDDIKEAFGSENLVEIFRTGNSLGLDNGELKDIISQTYNQAGGTQEDLINDIYFNMDMRAQQHSEGAYV